MSDISVLPSMDLTPAFTRTKANRETVLKVKCSSEASLRGSKGAFVNWCNTGLKGKAVALS